MDRSPTQICESFTNLHELIDLVKEESAKESLRNINCILTIVASLGGKWPTKKPHKEKMEVQKKEKILDNIVLEKEEKGFYAKDCCLVTETIGEKYDVYFLFGTALMPNVEIEVYRFKWFPPNIIYRPFSNVHVDKIKKKIVQYNKYDTKASIFAILKDQKIPNCILLCKPKNWKEMENHQFFIIGQQHTIVTILLNFLLHFMRSWIGHRIEKKIWTNMNWKLFNSC